MTSPDADIASLAPEPRHFSWLGRSVLAGPDPTQGSARCLATDLGWFLATTRQRNELLDVFERFLLFDSIGPRQLSQTDISLLGSLDNVSILCPVTEDMAALAAILPPSVHLLSTPPALVYFPLMLPDFTADLPSWNPEAPRRFLMAGRVRRDFRLLGEIQHDLPAPVEVVTDLDKVDLRVETNIRLNPLMGFPDLCRLAASSQALLVVVEAGHRAGLATLALGLALGMPVVASSVPGVEAIADRTAPDEGLVTVRPGDGAQLLSVLHRLLHDVPWARNLARQASRLSVLLERDAEAAARHALEAMGI